jgi:hypothetical protein
MKDGAAEDREEGEWEHNTCWGKGGKRGSGGHRALDGRRRGAGGEGSAAREESH